MAGLLFSTTSGWEKLGAEKLLDRAHNRFLVLRGQLGIERQGQDLCGGKLRRWKITFLVPQSCEAFLQVQRYRVVNFALDAAVGQKAFQFAAPIGANDVVVKYVSFVRSRRRYRDNPIAANKTVWLKSR